MLRLIVLIRLVNSTANVANRLVNGVKAQLTEVTEQKDRQLTAH